MAYTRRDIRGGAVQTTISPGIGSGDSSFTIVATTGWPDGSAGGFYVVIDPGTASEEKVLCSTRSSSTVHVTTRGADGTTASSHSDGAVVYPCHSAVDDDEANLAVSKLIGAATAAGQIPVVDAANSFAMVQAKTSGQILVGNGTTIASVPVTGDVTLSSAGVVAIGNSKVTSNMIVDGAILNADINASAAIALSKLATDPLARANHTGTQLMSTISNAGALATLNTVGSAQITDASIATGDIALLAIDSTLLAANAVTTAKITDANVTAAKLAAGLPQGYVTGATVTANQTGLSTGTDLTSMTITVTGDGVKRLRIFVKATFAASGGAGLANMTLQEGATVLDTVYVSMGTATDQTTMHIDYDFVPTAASHTYKVRAGKNAFDMDLVASSTNRARIYAEWIA